ncbi:nucleotidyltransferase domain-containing protein [Caldithrix abyssi]|nr:nucleotidyltransferase domain-containing protein [Caldithrix abyssi]
MNHSLEKKIRNYFQNKPNVIAVYIFGSFVMGNERYDSDIDIALLLDKGQLHFSEKSKMTLDLMQITDREIDLVSMNDVSSILQMQIFKKGKRLFCSDTNKLNQFQVQAVKTYLDLKRIRKPIEDQLKNVSIYG